MKIYLVGGAVRDMLLGLEPKDTDYVVVGSTIEEMLEKGFQKVGADFPVFLHPDTGDEYALARTEQKTGPGYHGFDTRFTPDVTLEQDLARRDLTINAMAIDEQGNVVDPYGGQEDLRDKILRHTSEAFKEDPVRVLRLARFAARYHEFEVHDSTSELVFEMLRAGELNHLTPERVWAEFEKGLMEDHPSRMFRFLVLTNVSDIFPEFFGGWPIVYRSVEEAATDKRPLEVRFAIVASGFTNPEAYKKWRIPSDCEEVSTLVNNNLQSFKNWDNLTPEEKVQLFNRCDLFRRPERFKNVVNAAYYILKWGRHLHLLSESILHDMGRVQSVNGGEIAAQIADKTKIKDAIFQARCKAIME